MNIYRQKGFETDNIKYTKKGTAGNVGKLEESLSRAKNTVLELALCNPWTLFCTFTLDKSKYDRRNLKKFDKDFSQFIRDYRKKYNVKVKSLLVPEQHEDGCWHMHGFILGLPIEHLKEFTDKDFLPDKIRNRVKQGKRIFTWEPYAKKFGFSSIELIENQSAASLYITKYITKDTNNLVSNINAHMYYASQGLNRAKVIRKGQIQREIESPNYKNNYATVKIFDNVDEPMSYFENIEFTAHSDITEKGGKY